MLEKITPVLLIGSMVLVLVGGGWAFNAVMVKLQARAQRIHQHILAALFGAMRRPGLLCFVVLALNLLPRFGLAATGQIALLHFQAVLWILIGTLFLITFVGNVKRAILRERPQLNPRIRSTLDIGSRTLQVTVLVLALLVGLSVYGVDITGIIALGGVSGIIVGLAAKDALANLFGGLIIFLDHPFDVGDWIICHASSTRIEGTVEEINWRVTKVRTFDKRALYVPNSTFTSYPVENPQRMTNRRIYETIGIRYSDAEHMADIISRVHQMLQEHPEIDTSQTMIVNFNRFGESSLDFFVYTFTHTTNWVKFHTVKQDVLLRILGIIRAVGADCAFPTHSVIIENAGD